MHINYNIFLPHYEEKKQVGLLIMKQQTLLQPREQLFQNLMIYTMRNKL